MSLDVMLLDGDEAGTIVYDANITHNLRAMAEAAGLYTPLWHPGDIPALKARDLIVPLAEGYIRLISDPSKYEEFEPTNGWGNYNNMVEFVRGYLHACIDHPDTSIFCSL